MLARPEFIAQQLKTSAPDADWNAGGIDRAYELALIFDRNNILLISDLKVISTQFEQYIPEHWQGTESQEIFYPESREIVSSFAFSYRGRQIGFMGTPDRSDYEPFFQLGVRGYFCAWSAAGHGHVGYVVRPNKARKALEIVPVWDSSSDAGAIRDMFLTIGSILASVILPIAGISVGSSIGSALFGANFAAAYPVISAAVGNAAVATVFNGGDIGAAIKGAALGAVSGGVGSAVGSKVMALSDSAIFSAAASAAARAVVSGGDVKQAIAVAVVSKGASMFGAPETFPYEMPELVSYDISEDVSWNFDPNADPVDWTGGGDEIWPGSGTRFDDGGAVFDFPPLDSNLPGFTVDQNLFPISVTEPAFVDSGSSFGFGFPALDASLPGFTINPNLIPIAQPYAANSPAFNPQPLIQGITQAALSALQVVSAFRALSAPTLQPRARVVQADGSVSVISSNGTIQTRSPSGAVVSTRPPVGVPQATIDGSFVVNNGDGSFTRVTASGQSERLQYTTTSPGSIPGSTIGGLGISAPVLLIGGAAILLLAMRKGK